ncbi:Kelch repeat-containing protein [Streptomyces jumonjinensis]|uniref:Uncharacterized protein n=1 Tax=Streptomyces jumonjinensis TaxID=1945 RepID=A0A646KCP3_STRJU|nr:hypothetical protein [Streptomyces jumonjinensis]MQS99973.1 hypothetical protein [Streptomyces jumonjinensis]
MSPELSVSRDARLKRLRQRLHDETPPAAFEGQVQASRGAHLLYGVMLHAAARMEAGLELTRLESQLVGPVVRLLSREEVCDFGRVYQEEAAFRGRLFPDSLATRPVADGYSHEDLLADLPALHEEIAAQANVSVVDLDAPDSAGAGGADGAPLSFDSPSFREGMAAYGYGVSVVTASAHQEAAQERPPLQVDMTLPRFFCDFESHEVSGSNEIYWALAAGADEGVKQESITRTYGDVDNNETHNMDANTVLFRGTVGKVLIVHIELWEEDQGVDPELARTIKEIATALQDTADILSALPGGTQWQLVTDFVAMLGGIGQLVGEIIGWLEDDLLTHRTIAFDRGAMDALADPIYQQPDVTWRFPGPTAYEGSFTLDIRSRYTQPSSNDIALLAHATGGWSGRSLPWPRAKTPGAPALALHNGNLYCAVRGGDNKVYVSRRETSGTWSAFGAVPGLATNTPPALASYNGQLYLAVKQQSSDNNNGRAWVASSDRGDAWSPGITHDYIRTAPALAVHQGRLWLAAFGGTDGVSLLVGSRGTGGSWEWLKEHTAHKSQYAPAMTMFQNRLHLAYRDSDSQVCFTVRDDAFNASPRWAAAGRLSGTTPNGPALAVVGTQLHCAVRGGDDNIWHCTNAGTGWTPFTVVPTAGKTLSSPALAPSTATDLHLVYRALH